MSNRESDYARERAAEQRGRCRHCGTSDAECMRIVLASGEACCKVCYLRDTHPEEVPESEDGVRPEWIEAGVAAVTESWNPHNERDLMRAAIAAVAPLIQADERGRIGAGDQLHAAWQRYADHAEAEKAALRDEIAALRGQMDVLPKVEPVQVEVIRRDALTRLGAKVEGLPPVTINGLGVAHGPLVLLSDVLSLIKEAQK